MRAPGSNAGGRLGWSLPWWVLALVGPCPGGSLPWWVLALIGPRRNGGYPRPASCLRQEPRPTFRTNATWRWTNPTEARPIAIVGEVGFWSNAMRCRRAAFGRASWQKFLAEIPGRNSWQRFLAEVPGRGSWQRLLSGPQSLLGAICVCPRERRRLPWCAALTLPNGIPPLTSRASSPVP